MSFKSFKILPNPNHSGICLWEHPGGKKIIIIKKKENEGDDSSALALNSAQ